MPTALVTGASTGIGRDLAVLAAKSRYDVIAVARSRAKLRDLEQSILSLNAGGVRSIVLDLALPGAATELVRQIGPDTPDILINNAGVGMRGLFHELDTAQQMAMLQLNVNALTELTRIFLPGMVQRRRGRIMNVASIAAFQPGPLMAVYYASKAYVLSLSEALHNEVQSFGITVTALCPGPTSTDFADRAGIGGTKLFQGPNRMTSEEVAEAGWKAMMSGKSVVIPGPMNRVMAFATRFTPRQVTARIARSLQENG